MKDKLIYLLVFIVSTCLCVVAGLYAGGYVFIKLTHMDMSILSYDTLFNYYEQYQHNASVVREIKKAGAVSVIVSLVPTFFIVLLFIAGQTKEELHGSARWANDMEIRQSGLVDLNDKGRKEKYPPILLGRFATGRYKGKLIKFYGQQFVGTKAPTRSGKGVGLVIPNLLNYTDSIVVNDIKFENFRYTAGFRQSCGQKVFLFAPDGFALDEKNDRKNIKLRSHRYNPLGYIRRDPTYRIGDILAISAVFYPLTGDKNDIWNELAGKLFKGLCLYMLDCEEKGMPVTFSQLLKLTTPEGGLKAWMQKEIKEGVLSDECVAEFNAFISAPDETRGSILSNLVSPLAIFSDPVCAAATSANDFDLERVRKERMSIYIGMQAGNLKKFSKLLNLLWSQLINLNTNVLPEYDCDLKYQCLMMIDEFAALGHVDIIKHSSAFTAGYNMRYFLIYQSDSQLEDPKLYGKEGAKTINENLAVNTFFPPKKVDSSTKEVSDTLGYKTVKIKSVSKTVGKNARSRTFSTREERRALMLPQELVELGFETVPNTKLGVKQIILMENMRPFIADKIIYFKDEVFLNRKNYSTENIPDIPILNLDNV
ncbi:type IV secretory system conjugative DNA transfer family protein [Photobacterium damselae]|uniref:type IV secretory system conjugative DNA transfer family protein n=1 Tax=Photobacterium damselae TaxID=38293 RepID=UPI000A2FC34A|nr:type IV secretory system conjugative DNA transfer family protein [Photobacterium damselae]ARR51948.1 conjugal transfer protein TraK [Photobacterium damselae subsp. damselae]